MKKARLIVDLDVKPDMVDAFIAMFTDEFTSRSRQEDGCEFYELWQSTENPTDMCIVEVWSSQQHLDTHLAQDWFSEWAPKMEAMQASSMVIRTMQSV